MLTSSATIVHQKASVPISPINGYGPAASLHHPALEPNLSSQPQSPPHASPAAVSSTTNTSVLVPELTLQGALPATLGPTVSHQESNGSLPVRTKRPQPQEQDHTQRCQSTAFYFQPKDSDRRLSCEDLPQGLLTPEDSHWKGLRRISPQVFSPLLAPTLGRMPSQYKTDPTTTLEPRQEQQPQPPTAVSVPDATLVQEEDKDTSLLQPSITTSANAISISTTITEASTPDSELRADLQNEGDLDCVATSSRSMKRSNSSGSWTDQTNKKRTRSSNQGGAKRNKVMEERRPQQESQLQEGPALKKKGSLKQMAKASPTPSAPAPAPAVPTVAAVDQSKDVAHAGDDTTVDHNNDYCEACSGLGEFICCDSCPKAFHFSCCQPPIDPMALPDEWNLVANSDGEYEDAVDYKPRPKRAAATANAALVIKADSEALQLHDPQGQIRLCFQCGKSALRDRFMISCDHCPLHWHLDCLSPPMACPPPSTNKWMCPNHADHVMPRRRKRKDATAVELKDPRAANDGLIEVIPEPESSNMSIWNQDTSAILFRVPERNIKHSFVEKCQRIRDQQIQQQQEQQKQQLQKALSVTQVSASSASITVQPFDLLIAAAMADDRVSGASLQSSVVSLSSTSKSMDVAREERHQLQEAVLSRMTDPAERQEYQRFRAFQRYLRELGSEEAMKRWLEQQEREKEEIARQGLLGLF
ncbi:hypothetical protein BGZ89_009283 [Linnemannia elongata]|nr:hypothetical protein BGZ89_009283 [Linnemannia elongata]